MVWLPVLSPASLKWTPPPTPQVLLVCVCIPVFSASTPVSTTTSLRGLTHLCLPRYSRFQPLIRWLHMPREHPPGFSANTSHLTISSLHLLPPPNSTLATTLVPVTKTWNLTVISFHSVVSEAYFCLYSIAHIITSCTVQVPAPHGRKLIKIPRKRKWGVISHLD